MLYLKDYQKTCYLENLCLLQIIQVLLGKLLQTKNKQTKKITKIKGIFIISPSERTLDSLGIDSNATKSIGIFQLAFHSALKPKTCEVLKRE